MTHPVIRELFQSLGRHPAFQEILRRVMSEPKVRLSLSGLTTTAKALYLMLLWQVTERPLLILADGNQQAERLIELVETFFDLIVTGRDPGRPLLLPALDVLPHQNLSPHSEIAEKRAIGLWRMASRPVPITIAPVGAALMKTESTDFYRQLALHLRTGEELPLDDLILHLESVGYEKRDPVEMVGEYSLRGGILDIFPAEAQEPLRIEFFGDSIESMRRFDVETQRSVLRINDALVLPTIEYPKSRELFHELAEVADRRQVIVPGESFPGWEFYVPLVRPREKSIFSLMKDALIVLDEPELISSAADRLWKRLDEPGKDARCPAEKSFFHWDELRAMAEGRSTLSLRELEVVLPPEAVQVLTAPPLEIPTRPSIAFHGNMQSAVAESRTHVERGGKAVFFAGSTGELERFADILQEYSVPFQLGIEPSENTPRYLAERAYLAGPSASTYLVKGTVRRGTVFVDAKLAVFGSEDLFDTSNLVGQQPSRKMAAAFAADIADLKPGDFVVHATHGVGRFLGLRTIQQGDQNGDFMLVEYAADAKLYVPLTRLDLIQKYRGAGEGTPPMDRLGGATWTRTKTRVKAKMRDMADELLKLYAQRKMADGFPFSRDSNWQREFEDAFEFTETKRPARPPWRDIKRDMEEAAADGPVALRRRRLRQDRSGDARRLQSSRGRQAGGGARAHYGPCVSTLTRPSSAVSQPFPVKRRDVQPVSHRQGD